MPYAQNVLGWAAAYATGVVPVDLPPMTGPPPPLGDAHLEHPEGLGPNLPMNINGLPLDDPLARIPLIDLSSPALVSPAADVPVDDAHAAAGACPSPRLHGDLHQLAGHAARGPAAAVRAPAATAVRRAAPGCRSPAGAPGRGAGPPGRRTLASRTGAQVRRPVGRGARRAQAEAGRTRSSQLTSAPSRTPTLGGDVPP